MWKMHVPYNYKIFSLFELEVDSLRFYMKFRFENAHSIQNDV